MKLDDVFRIALEHFPLCHVGEGRRLVRFLSSRLTARTVMSDAARGLTDLERTPASRQLVQTEK